MKEFLRKIKLIDDWTTHLPISQQDFVDRLSAITEERELGLFSDAFMPFKSSQKEYAGHVGFDEFKIKRRARYFEQGQNLATATGTFIENNGDLTIETEINGFSSFMILFYSILLIGLTGMITVIISLGKNTDFLALLPILFIGALMFFITYMVMRISIGRMKYDLEREFFYLTKK